jgi:hypothetical protein
MPDVINVVKSHTGDGSVSHLKYLIFICLFVFLILMIYVVRKYKY